MPGRNHASAAAPSRTRATAGKQDRSREPPATAQRQQQHTRRSVQDELLEAHDDPDKILRKPRRKRGSAPKGPDNNDGLPLEAEGSYAPALRNSSERSIGYRAVYSQDGTYSAEEDPVESWYRNVGYLIPLDESAIDVLEQVLPLFAMSSVKRLHKTTEDRTLGLRARNVQLDPCLSTDPFLDEFHNMKPLKKLKSGSNVYLPDLHEKVKKYHDDEWGLDLQKAIKDELEATFQRTVMMSMVDRYRLVYNLKDGNQSVLDFAVESTWKCPFMPTRALKREKPDRQRMLSRPQPDISIAFHLEAIIADGLMSPIPEATKRIMIYEGQDGTRTQRAFHFLMIEAKNANKTSDDKDGHLQILNSASQSLHCLYEFFNEADRKEVECGKSCCTSGASIITKNAGGQDPSYLPSAGENTFVARFFKEVRVFTAVPTSRAITIRVHRACLASASAPLPSHDGRPPFQLRILPDYPLQFEYNEVMKLTNDISSRGKLVDTFKKIMVDYGIGQLRPLLQEAATAIATKFFKWESDNGMQYELGMKHYSHGQTAPTPSRQSSRAVSQGSRWSSASDRSRSRPPSQIDRLNSSAPTNSPEAYFSQPVESYPEPPRKKTKRR